MPNRWFKPTKQWPSHPLFIALATVAFTAILSSILVPYLTSQWQANERELDVKFDLAKEVSDTVISTLMKPFRFHNINCSSIESVNSITPKMVEGAIEVAESCDNTRQRLILYFPGNDRLRKEWGDICTSLTFFYWYRIIPRRSGGFLDNLFDFD